MKSLILIISSVFMIIILSCSSTKTTTVTNGDLGYDSTSSGLKFVDINTGKGKTPRDGSKCTVYMIITDANGNEIENSYKTKSPVTFTIGKSDVIKGLEEGVMSMKQGGKRKLLVPPELGFGARALKSVPGNSHLFITVELTKVD